MMGLLKENWSPSTIEQLAVQDFDESVEISEQDGSYSEVLSSQPSVNSFSVDELLEFRRIENACIRSEIISDLNSQYNTPECISMLLKQREFLIQSISEYEKHITSMKLALKKVNAQLEERRALKLITKLEKSFLLDKLLK